MSHKRWELNHYIKASIHWAFNLNNKCIFQNFTIANSLCDLSMIPRAVLNQVAGRIRPLGRPLPKSVVDHINKICFLICNIVCWFQRWHHRSQNGGVEIVFLGPREANLTRENYGYDSNKSAVKKNVLYGLWWDCVDSGRGPHMAAGPAFAQAWSRALPLKQTQIKSNVFI